MKTLFKSSLLVSALLTVATSVFAITGDQTIGLATTNLEVATVPEPSTLALLGLGIVLVALFRRKK